MIFFAIACLTSSSQPIRRATQVCSNTPEVHFDTADVARLDPANSQSPTFLEELEGARRDPKSRKIE
jgi:hypothetical protein